MIRSRVSALAVVLVLAAACDGKAKGSEDKDTLTNVHGMRINIMVRGRHVSPRPAVHKVGQGKQVDIYVISNVTDTMDVRGYNKTLNVSPTTGAQLIAFTADKKGLFPVELRRTHLRLFQIQVT